MIFKIILEGMIFIVLIVGVLVISNTVHELKHVYDIKDVTNITEICVWNIPTSLNYSGQMGYVKYVSNDLVNSPEWKAYVIDFISVIIMFWGYFYLRWKKQ